ncbi:MAG: CRISPR-associated helicase Cas3', partial [Anaerolineae bacterium]|nr:CRISPR-associated helicase Cas3' [Anaerolineae bacterium]
GVSPQLMPHDEALSQSVADTIYKALRDFFNWRNKLPADDKIRTMLYRGTILASDHSASAGVGIFPAMKLSDNIAMKPFEELSKKLNRPIEALFHSHQTHMQAVPLGHAIMIAPTGSGKTEAAILWATTQMAHKPASRLFYTLPYQASMNAMANRLSEKYFEMPFGADDNDQVTIQHSRSTLKFYQDAMDRDDMLMDSDPEKSAQARKDTKRASEIAKKRQNLAQLNYFPIQVFSPYQMLKAAYGLKGYEALLLDYTDALFIFDEIHAYDPKRLALVISYIGYLEKYFRARFLIMTATLPPLIENALRDVLPAMTKIRADQTVFDQSKRHTVHFIEGDISAQIEAIIAHYDKKESVLVVCNQVKTAQKLYDQFKQRGFSPLTETGGDVMLLHGRFNGKDRRDKEALLMRYCGVDDHTHRRRVIVIATQVVEVSLNVDFDTLFTEPAPLEALLQRFGRVNRGRPEDKRPKDGVCPVYIMTAPYGDSYKPYDEPMVMQSVAVLRGQYDGHDIDESQIDAMLAHIYTGDIAEQWQKDYAKAKDDFEQWALGALKPFESAGREIVEQFYKLFDGTQVLPVDLETEYYEAIEKHLYIEANQYLVNITNGQYHQLRHYGLITEIPEGEFFAHVRVDYNPEYGLMLHDAIEKAKNPTDNSLEDEDV